MLGRIVKYLLLAAIAGAPLSGCAYMSKSGRQQMAYQRYIRKQSGRKMKIQKKIKSPKMPRTPDMSPNKVNAEVIETPQSVRSGESQPESSPPPPSPQ